MQINGGTLGTGTISNTAEMTWIGVTVAADAEVINMGQRFVPPFIKWKLRCD
ncbi:MAG: hypothetical protein ACC645_01955 [Pirellulales bacterium]